MKRLKKIVWIFAAIGIAYGIYYFVWGNPTAQTQNILSWAKLGSLPASAKNISYHSWSGLGTGEEYAKFQLSTEDLQTFIARASALSDWKSDIFDPSHQLRPHSESNDQDLNSMNHEYMLHDHFPSWFDMTIRNKGRRFTHTWGSLAWIVINEENNTVYLWVVKG